MLLIFCPAVNLSGVISQLFLSLLSHCHYTKSTSLPPDDMPLDALSVLLSFPVPFLYKSPPHMDSARRMYILSFHLCELAAPPAEYFFSLAYYTDPVRKQAMLWYTDAEDFQKDFLHLLLQQVCQDTSHQFCLK